jgi:glycosyltransferase involved in cell wall biosynthesis
LVEPKDPDALADALARLIGDEELRRSLADAGSRRAPDFDWTHVTTEIVSVYQQAIQRHRAAASEPASLPVRTR